MNWRSVLDRMCFWRSNRIQLDVAFPSESELKSELANALLKDLITERVSNRRWTLAKRSAIALTFVGGFVGYAYYYAKFAGWSMLPSQPVLGVVRLAGEISDKSIARADMVIPALTKAYQADNVKAVAILVDSPGGAPVEAERIINAITHLKTKHPKPTYAVIGNLGASAGYMVAMHADAIYAGRYSLVGSIGAVMASWDVHKALARFEIYQRVFASGELKAMLNPFTEPTPEGVRKAEVLVSTLGERFQGDLVAIRGERLMHGEDYGSGEVWDGERARALGLVDELGTLETLQARLESDIGELKIHDFGPGAPAQFPFAASAGAWLEGAVSRTLRSMVETPEIR